MFERDFFSFFTKVLIFALIGVLCSVLGASYLLYKLVVLLV